MGDLAADTAVEEVAPAGTGRASARDWEIWGPNGGYLAVIALRAAGAHTPLRRPASFTCHFLGVADFDDVDLEVRSLRESKRAASLRGVDAPARQADPRGDRLGRGRRRRARARRRDDARRSPTPESLPTIAERLAGQQPGPYHKFWSNFDERPLNWIDNWEEREPGDPQVLDAGTATSRATRSTTRSSTPGARCCSWTRWAGRRPCGRTAGDMAFYAPSIDVSAQFHALAPESPWLLAECRSPVARDGLVGERGVRVVGRRPATRERRPADAVPADEPPEMRRRTPRRPHGR